MKASLSSSYIQLNFKKGNNIENRTKDRKNLEWKKSDNFCEGELVKC